MRVYLASPSNRDQHEAAKGMPVLISYVGCRGYVETEFAPTFSHILIDSGAFSEMNSGVKVDLTEYADWSRRWVGHADAIAGLDDITGDWRRSLRNYEAFRGGSRRSTIQTLPSF